MRESSTHLAHFFYTHLRVMKSLKYLKTLSLIIKDRELLTLMSPSLSHHDYALNISLKVPSSLPKVLPNSLVTYPSITLPSTPRAGAETSTGVSPGKCTQDQQAGHWHHKCSGASLYLIRTSIQEPVKTLSDEAFSKSSQFLVVPVPVSAHC